MIKKLVISTLLVTVLPFTLVSFAEAKDAPEKALSSARQIVDQYKELRNACTAAKGDERLTCYTALNNGSEEYTQARRLVRESEQGAPNKVHFVSFR